MTGPRRIQSGVPTADLIVSAHMGSNADVFPHVLALHVPQGARIADVTFGTGVFWTKVDPGRYQLLASDLSREKRSSVPGIEIEGGIDCRVLPYQDGSIDCVVLDPPYMESFYRNREDHRGGQGSHSPLGRYYSSGEEGSPPGKGKWHQAVVDIYVESGREALRVLGQDGVLIVKCQDEVSANRQRLTHVEIIAAYEEMGFYVKDLFVVIRRNAPAVSRLKKQVHARKNHSYFLIFEKTASVSKRRIRNTRVDVGGDGET